MTYNPGVGDAVTTPAGNNGRVVQLGGDVMPIHTLVEFNGRRLWILTSLLELGETLPSKRRK